MVDVLARLVEKMGTDGWGWAPTFQLSIILLVVFAGVAGIVGGVGFLAHSLAGLRSSGTGLMLGGASLGAGAAACVGYAQRRK
jgi:hypothetical protein